MPRILNQQRPSKPRPDFPLFPHASGVWAKKVRGRMHYFGPWDDPQGALERWVAVKDDLLAGRTPNKPDALTIKELVDRFLEAKRRLIPDELTERSWIDYKRIGDVLIAQFRGMLVESLRPDDFGKLRAKWAKTNGPVSLGNNIRRAKVIFNFAWNNDLIDRPVRFGDQFAKPSKATIRKSRRVKLLSAGEIRKLIEFASPEMKAMILLGINCGLGNTDCARLTSEHIHGHWLDYPRGKTGIHRRCNLWPETLEAIRATGLPFKTMHGNHWSDGAISQELRKLLDEIGVNRPGVNFYTLRRTFQTEGQKIDREATRYIMGHADESMSALYNQEPPSDAKLKAVTDGLRRWLFAPRLRIRAAG